MPRLRYTYHLEGDIEGMPRWQPDEERDVSDAEAERLSRSPRFVVLDEPDDADRVAAIRAEMGARGTAYGPKLTTDVPGDEPVQAQEPTRARRGRSAEEA